MQEDMQHGADNLERLFLLDEGLRLRLYTDTVGVPTIGVGRNLKDRGISLPEALQMMRNDIAVSVYVATMALDDPIVWSGLSEPRRAALQSMAHNLGLGGLRTFKRMLQAIGDSDFKQAAVEMLNSKWAAQVGVRATRLATMMATGNWPEILGEENQE